MTTAVTSPPRHLRWLIAAAIVGALVATALIPDVRDFLGRAAAALRSPDPAVTRAFVTGLGWAGPLALIAGFVVQAVVPVVPAVLLIAVTARAYGPVEGFFIVYAGTLLGAAAGYGLGRAVGDALVRLLAGENARLRAQAFAERHGVQGVLMIRLMPVLSSDVMSLVAGAARMGLRPFMLATALGALPVTLLVVWLSEDTERLIVGLGVLSAVVAAVAVARWQLGRRARRGPPPVG